MRPRWLPLLVSIAGLTACPDFSESDTSGSSTGTECASTSGCATEGGSSSQTPSTTAMATSSPGDDTATTAMSVDDTAGTGPSDTGPADTCPVTHTCVTAPPEGWSMPAVLQLGSRGAPSPCGGAFPTELFAGPVDPIDEQADCMCSCDPSTLSCATTTVGSGGGACGGFGIAVGAANSVACVNINDVSTGGSGWTANTDLLGTCQKTDVDTVPRVEFADDLTVCEAELVEDGCVASDEICAPKPLAPFSGQSCIFAEGDLECPARTVFTDKTVYMRNFEDDRSCSPCACDPLPDKCVGGEITLHNNDTCAISTGVAKLAADAQCVALTFLGSPIGTAKGMNRSVAPTVPAGLCTHTGGAPLGAVTGIDPITVCCEPG